MPDKEVVKRIFISVISILFISYNSPLLSQNMYVIAPRGLNVRNAPSINSEIIGRLKFKDQVEYADEITYGLDTLYISRNYGYYDDLSSNVNRDYEDRLITGNWRKIKYKTGYGYTVDSYLFKNVISDEIERDDIKYVDKSSTSWRLEYDYSVFDWYGIFLDGDTLSVKKTTIDVISDINEYSGEIISYIYDNRKTSIGIIGVLDTFTEREFLPNFIANSNERQHQFFNTSSMKLLTDDDPGEIQVQQNHSLVYYYVLKSGKKKYFKSEEPLTSPIEITLIADIDGDLKDDYIVRYRTIYDLYADVLFLSRDKVNDIYRPTGYSWLDFD